MRQFIFFLFLSLGTGVGAQEGEITQSLPLDFTVSTDGLYTFEIPSGSSILALWKKEPGGRSLISRNLNSSGKPLTRWQVRLTAGSPYQISLQAGLPSLRVSWSLVLSGPLAQPLTTGSATASASGSSPGIPASPLPQDRNPPVTPAEPPVQPAPREQSDNPRPAAPTAPPPLDYGEWKKLAVLPLSITPAEVRIAPSTSGLLLGVLSARKLQVWKLDQGQWSPMGGEKDASTWNSWDLGWDGVTPVVTFSYLAQAPQTPELRVERWNEETWQITPLPGAIGGTVTLVSQDNFLGMGAWDLSERPRWRFWNLKKNEAFPAPNLPGPLSALYSLAPATGGPWAAFQIAEGRERWYEVYRFDGSLWTSLDFPRVKNVRSLLFNPGRSATIGVVDGTGRPQLYQKDREFWTALPPPDNLIVDPRGQVRLGETEAGLYLLTAQKDQVVWYRRKEGVWTASSPLSRVTFWDHWSAGGTAGAVVQTQGTPGQLEILQLP